MVQVSHDPPGVELWVWEAGCPNTTHLGHVTRSSGRPCGREGLGLRWPTGEGFWPSEARTAQCERASATGRATATTGVCKEERHVYMSDAARRWSGKRIHPPGGSLPVYTKGHSLLCGTRWVAALRPPPR